MYLYQNQYDLFNIFTISESKYRTHQAYIYIIIFVIGCEVLCAHENWEKRQ